MSFKYRFILSFVLLEVFFIILIVSVNFFAISNSSKTLINDRIKSDITFIEELVKIPLSIYDLATLDNLLEKTKSSKHINSVIVLDSRDRVLSKQYSYKHQKIDEFLSSDKDQSLIVENHHYQLRHIKIYEDEVFLGSVHMIFDITENATFIQKNKERTLIIIFIEILISTLLSYIIGNKLTQMLIRLTKVSQDIAQMKNIDIPYQDKTDEIGILAKSMNKMNRQITESYTNLKQLTIIQDKQKKDLEIANKSKDDFLANMSHELKTPLNSINIISSVMMKNKKQTLDKEQVKNLNIINRCGNELLFLINDVLDISKLEAGELELNYETFNLKETLCEINDMIVPQAKEKKVEFIYEYNMQTLHIYSDKQRLKQILKNFISNSLKFVKDGYIKFSASEDEENFIVKVEDNGIGIPKEKLETIFDRFKQADGSTTRKYGGTGLGLAISRELSILLGGKIEVESIENEKTVFTLTLPKNSSQVDMSVVSSLSEEVIEEENRKVIILNNNPILLMNLIVSLKKEYLVDQVNSLDKLLKKETENKYSLIFIDTKGLEEKDLESTIDKVGEKTILIGESSDSSLKSKVKLIVEQPLDTKKLLSQISTFITR